MSATMRVVMSSKQAVAATVPAKKGQFSFVSYYSFIVTDLMNKMIKKDSYLIILVATCGSIPLFFFFVM